MTLPSCKNILKSFHVSEAKQLIPVWVWARRGDRLLVLAKDQPGFSIDHKQPATAVLVALRLNTKINPNNF